ncbi:MAG: DHH family phosphoesterase [Lachnospiraceae bacterium]|jgi:c-di-AMP phosphodiesterase-like protein|nr:DHH family phosphoesterase [Lachnospiraceae bacterium]
MKNDMKLKGWLQRFLGWPLYLGILVAAMTAAAYVFNLKAGFICTGLAAVYFVAAFWFYFVKRPLVMRELLLFAVNHAQIQKQLLSDLDVPYALLDEQGRVLWINKAFGLIIRKEKSLRKRITDLFSELPPHPFSESEEEAVWDIAYENRFYRLHLKNIYMSADNEEGADAFRVGLIAAYLFDETEKIQFQQEIENQKLVAGLIYLDNYEEALESIEEVRRSLLVALIDRKINKYFASIGGVVKKIEKDKYFLAIKKQYMESLTASRFSLLEDVKTVNIGNDMAVTLSIGLGMGGGSYIQNYEYARTAIDMALGRGGDQAVVKDGEIINYYGGKSQSQEKNTRVKARVKAHALRELLETREKIFIMGHKIGDADSLGAGVGIYRACATLNKKAYIVLNDITTSVRPVLERFMNNPDYPEDMFIRGDRAIELADDSALLVVVDVNRPSLTECSSLLGMIPTVVVLDHHRQTSDSISGAVLSYVEPYASSACEMVAEILQYIGDNIRIRQAEADAMYSGIVIDTNNFMNKTGVRTFEAAAFLRRNGADVTRVRKIFRDSMSDYKAKAEAVRQAEIFENAFAISVCPAQGVESPTIIGAQAANELLNIVGIKASVVLTEYQGKIYISARSIDEVNVQIIMEKLGGGGHMSVAGAQLRNCTIDEAKEQVKETIKSMLDGGEI